MRKRKTFLVGFVSMATIACTAIVLAYVFRDSVNTSSCARIREGMNEAEVNKILGRPCDEFYPVYQASLNEEIAENEWRELMRTNSTRIWRGPAGRLTVHFGESGTVDDSWFDENDNLFWKRIRRALSVEDEKPTLPAPHYLRHAPQYFPPSPPYPLPKELDSLEEAAKTAYDNPQPE